MAEAVRNLAQRSALAAKDITVLIHENVSKGETGAKVASESGAVLKDIVTSVKKVADLNNEIAVASQEQSGGLEQISKAANQLDQATQGNAASSEEFAASSEEMSSQAGLLTNLVQDLQFLLLGNGAQLNVKTALKPKSFPTSNVKPVSPAPYTKKEAKALLPFDEDKEDSERKIGNVAGF